MLEKRDIVRYMQGVRPEFTPLSNPYASTNANVATVLRTPNFPTQVVGVGSDEFRSLADALGNLVQHFGGRDVRIEMEDLVFLPDQAEPLEATVHMSQGPNRWQYVFSKRSGKPDTTLEIGSNAVIGGFLYRLLQDKVANPDEE